MAAHAGITAERWAAFSRAQQLLMIASEMNRASKLLADADRRRACYERILALADLTVQVTDSRGLRRELLRWRDLVAEEYVSPRPDALVHGRLFRALLQLHPETWKQLPYVAGVATF